MKAIILAGGSGTRMYPLTKVINKHFLPVYNKPIIYYPLALLMQIGIKDIILISSPEYINNYKNIFGDGAWLGVKIEYLIQPKPEGIAQCFLIAEKYIANDNVCLILGDNIFYSENYEELEKKITSFNKGGLICAKEVKNPSHYGVLEMDPTGKVVGIEEKPTIAKSNYAVTGLYFYDRNVVHYTKQLKPSARKELEITDLNNIYLKKNALDIFKMDQNYKWFDTGTYNSILDATMVVKNYEEKHHKYIACIEEIALRKNFIKKADLEKIILSIKGNSEYKQYLIRLLNKPPQAK